MEDDEIGGVVVGWVFGLDKELELGVLVYDKGAG
jgi:hypothetical protein